MKSIAAVITLMFLASGVRAGDQSPVTERKIVVCMENGAIVNIAVRSVASTVASKMFAEIGVHVDWRIFGSCPADAIRVRFVSRVPGGFTRDTLACARPQASYAEVFWDPTRDYSLRRTQRVLAHTLVHEITHILQGYGRHSDSGVMKAYWDREDLEQMTWKSLPFTPYDVELIHAGLDQRADLSAHRLAAAAHGPSPVSRVRSR